MIRAIFIAACAAIFLSSCVPNRKYVYMQKNDLKEKVLVDTVVRTYELNVEEYKIQPLDIISLRIESLTEDEFNFISKLYPQEIGGAAAASGNQNVGRGFLVDQHGDIEFPVVGKVKFGGLTVFEAEQNIKQVFKPFLKDPVARVRLLNFRFTVLGEVNDESQIVSTNTRVTLMEAIGMAGGLGELADRSKVKIVRQVGDKVEVFYMNLLDEEVLATRNFYVQQNDIIMVPALKQRPFRVYWAENLSIFVSTMTVVLLVLELGQN